MTKSQNIIVDQHYGELKKDVLPLISAKAEESKIISKIASTLGGVTKKELKSIVKKACTEANMTTGEDKKFLKELHKHTKSYMLGGKNNIVDAIIALKKEEEIVSINAEVKGGALEEEAVVIEETPIAAKKKVRGAMSKSLVKAMIHTIVKSPDLLNWSEADVEKKVQKILSGKSKNEVEGVLKELERTMQEAKGNDREGPQVIEYFVNKYLSSGALDVQTTSTSSNISDTSLTDQFLQNREKESGKEKNQMQESLPKAQKNIANQILENWENARNQEEEKKQKQKAEAERIRNQTAREEADARKKEEENQIKMKQQQINDLNKKLEPFNELAKTLTATLEKKKEKETV